MSLSILISLLSTAGAICASVSTFWLHGNLYLCPCRCLCLSLSFELCRFHLGCNLNPQQPYPESRVSLALECKAGCGHSCCRRTLPGVRQEKEEMEQKVELQALALLTLSALPAPIHCAFPLGDVALLASCFSLVRFCVDCRSHFLLPSCSLCRSLAGFACSLLFLCFASFISRSLSYTDRFAFSLFSAPGSSLPHSFLQLLTFFVSLSPPLCHSQSLYCTRVMVQTIPSMHLSGTYERVRKHAFLPLLLPLP